VITNVLQMENRNPKMLRKTANIDIRVEPQLIERIDAWRSQQRVLPSRSAAIVCMIEEFLQHDSGHQL
jgi:metal-responsive CopG/Arc/MetJ family transcriptional regulator